MKKITLGTRKSPLALAQTELVKSQLKTHFPHLEVHIEKIVTTGDTLHHANLYEVGGKGLFIKEIEEALLEGTIDIAVHSMKDMPAPLAPEFTMAAYLEREDPRDALISAENHSIATLKQGATIGTSSPRRAAQLLHKRPDLTITPMRGNVGTRLGKLESGMCDATILACAGLNRLQHKGAHTPIDTNDMLPAIAQGTVGLECLAQNQKVTQLLKTINHEETAFHTEIERIFLTHFGGSCTTPIAAYSHKEGEQVIIEAKYTTMDGKKQIAEKMVTTENKAEEEAMRLAKDFANQVNALV